MRTRRASRCRHMPRRSQRSIRRTAIIASTPDELAVGPADFGRDRSRSVPRRPRMPHCQSQRPSCCDETLPGSPGTRGLIMLETFSMTDFPVQPRRGDDGRRGRSDENYRLSLMLLERARSAPPAVRPQIVFGDENE